MYRRMFKFLVLCVGMVAFSLAVSAEVYNPNEDAPYLAIDGWTDKLTKKLIEANLIRDIGIANELGTIKVKATSDGNYTVYSDGMEMYTYIWDLNSNECVKVSKIVYLNGVPIYAYSSRINPDTKEIEKGGTYTFFDNFGQAAYVVTLTNNTPDSTQITDWVEQLLELVDVSVKNESGTFYIYGEPTEDTNKDGVIDANDEKSKLKVEVSDVRTQALGLASYNYMIDKIVAAGPTYIEKLRDAIMTMCSDTAKLREAIGSIHTFTGDETVDAYLHTLTTADGFKAVVAAIEKYEYDHDSNGETPKQGIITLEGIGNIIRGSFSTAEKETIFADVGGLLEHINNPDGNVNTADSLNEDLAKNLLVSAMKDGKRLYTYLPSIIRGDDNDADDYLVQKLVAWGERSGDDAQLVLNDEQIKSIREKVLAGGGAFLWLDDSGDIMDVGSLEPDSQLSLEDEAYAKVTVTTYFASNLDILFGRLAANTQYLFGTPDGSLSQIYLENNPNQGLLAFQTVVFGDDEYIVTHLDPGMTIADITEENKDQYTKLFRTTINEGTVDGEEKYLNPLLTAEDLEGAFNVYMQTLEQAALNQGLSVSRQRSVTIATGVTEGFREDMYGNLAMGNFDFTDASIEAFITGLANSELKNNYGASLTEETKNRLEDMSIEEKRKLVEFLYRAVKGEATALNTTEYFGGAGKEVAITLKSASGAINVWIGEVKYKEDGVTHDKVLYSHGTAGSSYTVDDGWQSCGIIIEGDGGNDGNNDVGFNDLAKSQLTNYSPETLAMLQGSLHVSMVTISGTKGMINVQGIDPTRYLPIESKTVSVNLDQLAKAITAGDPAITGAVLSVTDNNGNVLTAENFAEYAANGGTVYVNTAVWYLTDASNTVQIDGYFFNNMLTQQERDMFSAFLTSNNITYDFYNDEVNADGTIGDEDEMQVSTMEVQFQYLEGDDRTEAVVQVQNSLVDPNNNPLTVYGLDNSNPGEALGSNMYVLGLGVGPFEAHWTYFLLQ